MLSTTLLKSIETQTAMSWKDWNDWKAELLHHANAKSVCCLKVWVNTDFRYVSEGGFCGKPNPDGTRQMLLHGTKGLSAKGRALQCRFTKVRSDFAVAVSSQCFTVFLLNLRSHCLQCHLDQFVFFVRMFLALFVVCSAFHKTWPEVPADDRASMPWRSTAQRCWSLRRLRTSKSTGTPWLPNFSSGGQSQWSLCVTFLVAEHLHICVECGRKLGNAGVLSQLWKSLADL